MSAMRIEVGLAGADAAAALAPLWAVEDAAFEVWCAQVTAPDDEPIGAADLEAADLDAAGVEPFVAADVGAWSADDVAAWAAGAGVGSGLWTPFGELDPAGLSDAGRVDALVAVERLRGWVDAHAVNRPGFSGG